MDSVAMRYRYPRHSIPSRKKKRNIREGSRLSEKVALQTLVCILILAAVLVIKTVNSPVTSFLKEKTEGALTYNIDSTGIYQHIDSIISYFTKSGFGSKGINGEESKNNAEDEDFNQESLSTGLQYNTDSLTEDLHEEDTTGSTDNAATEINQSAQQTSESQNTNISDSSLKSTFIVPVGGYLGSPYGERIDPFTKKLKMHNGIDIEANQGASIKAAMEGEVIEAGVEPTLGNYLKIEHADGFATRYAHCSQLLVKKGQKVKQGDIIAKVGNTGASIGAHLHFEVWKDGKTVNPLSYISVPEK